MDIQAQAYSCLSRARSTQGSMHYHRGSDQQLLSGFVHDEAKELLAISIGNHNPWRDKKVIIFSEMSR